MQSKSQCVWTMEITGNLVPRYGELTGSAAIQRCVQESLQRVCGCSLVQLDDNDCVTVTPAMIA